MRALLGVLVGAVAMVSAPGAMASPALFGCRVLNPEEIDAPPAAESVCATALGVTERLAGHGVRRVDLGDGTAELPGDPMIVVAVELRPDRIGGRQPRLLLRAMPLKGGVTRAATGLPPASVDLNRPDWAEQAEASLGRMIGFLLR